MPPFTFNPRKNGNFFGSSHFCVSSCRHFVDSLKRFGEFANNANSPNRFVLPPARESFGRAHRDAPLRRRKLPPSSGGRDTPDATSLGEGGKGRRSPYGREMGTRIPQSPSQAPVTAPFRQGGHCWLPRAAAPTREREPRAVLPLGKGGKAGAALVGRRRS